MSKEDKRFLINEDKNAYLKLMELNTKNDKSFNAVIKMIECILGEEATKELEDMHLKVANYEKILTGLVALINNITYEEAEARFFRKKQQ